MSGRPTDWSPLGLGHDPVPGDPLVVASAARSFQDIANAIHSAEVNLRQISVNGQGKAIHKIRQKCDELADKIGKAHSVCDGADDALNPYVEVLETAQEDSLRELEKARQRSGERDRAKRHREEIRCQYNASRDPMVRNQLRTEYMQWDSRVKDASQAVSDARARLNDIIASRDKAAQKAASKLDELVKGSSLKDSWWDKVCGMARKVSKWLEKVKPWLDKISAVLSVAGTIIGCIPGLQVVGAVLKIAAAGTALLSLGAGLMINGRKLIDGEMTWGQFAASTGGDLLSALGATKAAKSAVGALKTARKALGAMALHAKDTMKWAARAVKLKKASAIGRLFGKAKDLWKGEPIKKAVLDRYAYHLWSNGLGRGWQSGVKYSFLKQATGEVYRGTRNLVKDVVVDNVKRGLGFQSRNNSKQVWEYYLPGRVKRALKPV